MVSVPSKFQRMTDAGDVIDAASTVLRRFGVELLIVSRPPHPDRRIEDAVLAKHISNDLAPTYSEWARVYSDRRYAASDPVLRQMKRTWKPFRWREVDYDAENNPRAREIMDERMKRGFGETLVVPIFDEVGFGGYVSMSGREIDIDDQSTPAIHIAALYAFHRIAGLSGARKAAIAPLSAREREVLGWIARSKSAWEIGEILFIAKRTVDEHSHSICQKLGAVNRTQAVAIAIRDGLIEP
jgi:LuxR family quorum sensing-dependent transcriptional regulator